MIDYLLTKRTIKDFLLLHNEKNWKHLISSTLEYGIESLKKDFNIVSISVNDIVSLLTNLKQNRDNYQY